MDQKPPPSVKNQKLSQKSNKRKPVKVVYISNPMKIKATPSEFRAVVQQLTGRYATSPPSDEELAGVLVKDNQQEDKEENRLNKWHSNCTTTSVMSASRTTRLDLFLESAGFRDDQVMEDLVVNPQMLEGFPSSLLPSDFGS